MDADTVSNGHEMILNRFEQEHVPILLGTQMVAKGLDFEDVTLVGVLSADISLYMDHYRAAERTFNLLTQVVGRAGRGSRPGRAVIQTYTPDNEVIQSAARQDYKSFYQSELRMPQHAALSALCRSFYLYGFRTGGGERTACSHRSSRGIASNLPPAGVGG